MATSFHRLSLPLLLAGIFGWTALFCSPARAQGLAQPNPNENAPAADPGDPQSPAEAQEKTESSQGDQALRQRVEQLEQQLGAIQEKMDEDELAKLRAEADTEALAPETAEEQLKDRKFVVASRSLQMFNPEISISGDFLATLIAEKEFYIDEDDRSGMPLRALDVHIQSSLDPFSQTKLALGFMPEGGVTLEEMHITWAGVLPNVSLTVGRFRQQMGVVQRWHQHDLDQTDYPLPVTELLGDVGLAQSGFSLVWLMPSLFATTNELTVQVTDGSNATLFAGEHFSVPTALVHLKNFYDLTPNTYMELGLSGMWGVNNRRGFTDEAQPDVLQDEDWRHTYVLGADLTLHWQPVKQSLYHSFTWRSEGFWVDRQTPGDPARGWGAYSYVQYQLSQRWFGGIRGDLVQPTAEDWGEKMWQAVPYLTFWQSEFVYLRLEARHGDGFAHGRDTRVLLQVNWAAGPHKHEKY